MMNMKKMLSWIDEGYSTKERDLMRSVADCGFHQILISMHSLLQHN